MVPLNSLARRDSEYLVSVSNELVYMVPPTSMWTGAVYRDAAATHGMPEIDLWFPWWYVLVVPPLSAGEMGAGVVGVGVGDDEFDMVGDVVGDVLILIWAAAAAANNRPPPVDDDKSRGSIESISRSRSISHFRLGGKKEKEKNGSLKIVSRAVKISIFGGNGEKMHVACHIAQREYASRSRYSKFSSQHCVEISNTRHTDINLWLQHHCDFTSVCTGSTSVCWYELRKYIVRFYLFIIALK